MAKPIVVSLDGIESSFDHIKLDRKRLCGERRRVPLDLLGETCVKSASTSDGLYLLQSGVTAQGYFDESGRWLQKSQLVGIGSDGQALEPTSSAQTDCCIVCEINYQKSIKVFFAVKFYFINTPLAFVKFPIRAIDPQSPVCTASQNFVI